SARSYLDGMAMSDSLLPSVRPLQRSEYERLIELGCFAGERVELLWGYIVRMNPQRAAHAATVHRLTRWLVADLDLPGKALVRCQLPLALSVDSEPEPDLAIVPNGEYDTEHPTTALWIIEVAESSVDRDRRDKAALYAAAGVPEYWVVNVVRREIEVRTEPE